MHYNLTRCRKTPAAQQTHMHTHLTGNPPHLYTDAQTHTHTVSHKTHAHSQTTHIKQNVQKYTIQRKASEARVTSPCVYNCLAGQSMQVTMQLVHEMKKGYICNCCNIYALSACKPPLPLRPPPPSPGGRRFWFGWTAGTVLSRGLVVSYNPPLPSRVSIQ